jgi:hypothetical protein
MIDEEYRVGLAHQLLARLERLSADSYWAHRASGMRGSLLKCLDQIEITRKNNEIVSQETWQSLNSMILMGFHILENAARAIRIQEICPGRSSSD